MVMKKSSLLLTRIFDIPMRPLCQDQKTDIVLRRPANPMMVIIHLDFARCTLLTHRNQSMKVALIDQSGFLPAAGRNGTGV